MYRVYTYSAFWEQIFPLAAEFLDAATLDGRYFELSPYSSTMTSPDYKRWLEWLAPYDPSPERYHHNRTGEDNGDAHHKRQVMGREVVMAITGGKLDFGPWEQIFYGEFDGRRPKRVLVKVLGE